MGEEKTAMTASLCWAPGKNRVKFMYFLPFWPVPIKGAQLELQEVRLLSVLSDCKHLETASLHSVFILDIGSMDYH